MSRCNIFVHDTCVRSCGCCRVIQKQFHKQVEIIHDDLFQGINGYQENIFIPALFEEKAGIL